MSPTPVPARSAAARSPRRAAAIAAGALLAALSPALVSTADAAPSSRLTSEAVQAGLEPGNAMMGWRNQGVAQESSTQRSAATAKVAAPTGVLGIDVASYQKHVNWTSWAARGRSFAYVKATEGTTYRNPYFSSQYNGSYRAGLIRGSYHFARPDRTAGYRQARYFVANGGGWSADGRTLPGVLDIEYNPYGSVCYGKSKAAMVSWISSFTEEYKKLTGRNAVIYTTTDWWKRCTGNTKKFSATNPVWVARWGASSPGALPGSAKKATFWQYSASPIDQNWFNGSRSRLKTFALRG